MWLGLAFRFLEQCCCAHSMCVCIYIYIFSSFMVIIFEKPWIALFNYSCHIIIENDLAIFGYKFSKLKHAL